MDQYILEALRRTSVTAVQPEFNIAPVPVGDLIVHGVVDYVFSTAGATGMLPIYWHMLVIHLYVGSLREHVRGEGKLIQPVTTAIIEAKDVVTYDNGLVQARAEAAALLKSQPAYVSECIFISPLSLTLV